MRICCGSCGRWWVADFQLLVVVSCTSHTSWTPSARLLLAAGALTWASTVAAVFGGTSNRSGVLSWLSAVETSVPSGSFQW